MRKMIKIFYKTLFLTLLIFSANAENKTLNIGSSSAKVTVKVFSSLTCPHCADFHNAIIEKRFY